MDDGSIDFDPNLQIKDLDTGKIVSIDEFDRQLNEFNSRQKSKNAGFRPKLPEDISLTPFLVQKKDFFYHHPYISDYLKQHEGNVRCVAASPDGQYAASGGSDGVVVVYSIKEQMKVEKIFKDHTSDVVMLEFSKDNFLLSCSVDSTARLWHPSSTKALGVFQHEEPVTAVSFLPTDSSIFLASTLSNTVFIWSVRTNEVLHKCTFVSPPTTATFSPDGNYVTIGCLNGFVFVYAMPDFRYVTQFIAGPRGKKQTSNKKVTSIVFLGNDRFIVATNDSRIRLYALENFSVVRKYLGHESKDSQLRVSVSPDLKLIMSPSENTDELFIWPVDHSEYFKGSGLFSSFLKDRSKTAEGYKFGKKVIVTAACFTGVASISNLNIIVALNNGSVMRLMNQTQ